MIKLKVVVGGRTRGAFCNPATSWCYHISTGPRCSGVISSKTYKESHLAYSAGLRFCKKLGLEVDV